MENLAVRTKSQTDPGNQGYSVYRSRSMWHWSEIAEGTRPQPIRTEIKSASRRLTIFLSATAALKTSKRVSKFIENCQMTLPGNFLSRSSMIITFSGNYHVSDPIN